MSKSKTSFTLTHRLYQLRYIVVGIALATSRFFLDTIMSINDFLDGLFDDPVEFLSQGYNDRLIRFQLERIDKGFDTGLRVLSFDLGHGCWIATVELDDEIAKDPRATSFVQDVVAYTTHIHKRRISTAFINESQVRIVVNDLKID